MPLEPRASWFDWHFTSTHSSSENFATFTRSGLHSDIIGASPWPWVAHSVSGLLRATSTSTNRGPRRERPIQTRFRFGSRTSRSLNLATQSNSSAHSSIGTPSPFRRRAPTACRPMVSGLFHSPLGVLFTFPSRYLCTIGRQGYLALEGGPPGFPRDFPCPVVLTYVPRAHTLSPTGLSPALAVHSRNLRLEYGFVTLCPNWGRDWYAVQPLQGMGPQAVKPCRFGLVPVRSPLLGESLLLYFPQGNEMFQFPCLPPQA